LPPPIAPPSPTLTEGTEHTVIKGDSFFTLAKKYNVTTKAIAAVNPGVDSSRLKIGQKLKIPPSTSSSPATPAGNGGNALISGSDRIYTVKSGDTLSRIARENGVSLKALRAENNLKIDQIKVGQKLKIPAKGSTPPEAAPSTRAGGSSL
jgi:LysM repeat protein